VSHFSCQVDRTVGLAIERMARGMGNEWIAQTSQVGCRKRLSGLGHESIVSAQTTTGRQGA